jgi:hypothetical protein
VNSSDNTPKYSWNKSHGDQVDCISVDNICLQMMTLIQAFMVTYKQINTQSNPGLNKKRFEMQDY